MQLDGRHATERQAQDGRLTIVPWYEPADFAEIRGAPANDVGDRDYDRWRGQAMQAIERLLRAGRALEIVTVRPADYRAWLALHVGLDSLEARQRFVCELAARRPDHPVLS
ncbi:hypothetical protein [Bosea sp. CS1GBMeth4]|uniref:hypothetical protein n=1 Tax=Bosea sp. CS1GBMeth4 TaxID=1892849 RepID=UPI0016466656|nr:hypothetical protein [Bosea sp. CS1GBMeth4]